MPLSSLQKRVLTALLLVPLVTAAVLLLPTAYLSLCLAAVVGLAAWEWTTLAGIGKPLGRIAYLLLVGTCLLLLWRLPVETWTSYLLIPVGLLWLAAAGYLLRLRRVEPAIDLDPALVVMGLPVLIGPWAAMVELHAMNEEGRWLVMFLLVLIWVVDSAAYFTGRRWGRAKLAPVLSPGKTRVGVYGALVAAACCGLLLAWAMGLGMAPALTVVAICVVTAFISVIGDLFESLLKRRRGLKDSGRLLPGHGGVLDRIDSLTAAAPVFALGMLWLGVSP
jgi:phosphatidate cytidylyltransferase